MNAINFARTAVAIAALAVAGLASATGSAGADLGSASVTSNSVAGSAAIGNGTSSAIAANSSYARSAVTSAGSASDHTTTAYVPTTGNNVFGTGVQTTTQVKQGAVEETGVTETYNSSYAKTTQTGSALAGALAVGTSNAGAAGAGEFHTSGTGPQGQVSGFTGATSDSLAGSVQNGTATHEGGMLSAYDSSADGKQTTVTTQGGVKIATIFVPTSQSAQSSENQVNTSVVGQAGSSGVYTNSNTGNGFGGLVNASIFGGSASATSSGNVAAAHAN